MQLKLLLPTTEDKPELYRQRISPLRQLFRSNADEGMSGTPVSEPSKVKSGAENAVGRKSIGVSGR